MSYKRISAIPVIEGGTGIITGTTAYAPLCTGTTATGAFQAASTGLGTSGFVLTSNGSAAVPSFQNVTASGAAIQLTGNSGVATASAGNINVITANTNVNFVGSGSTITQDFGGDVQGNLLIGALPASIHAAATKNTSLGALAMAANQGNNSLFNTAIGYKAANAMTNSSGNTIVGSLAFSTASTGNPSSNTAVGTQALASLNGGGNGNVVIGYTAAQNLLTGGGNVAIGIAAAAAFVGAETSNISINSQAVAAESNVLRIGQGTGTSAQYLNKAFICGIQGITVTGTAVLISSSDQLGIAVSSRRYKDNIQDMNDYSSPLYNLRPVTYNPNTGEDKSLTGGLIAEEVFEVMPKLVVLDKEDLPQTVKYHELIPLLLNEIQKLNKRIETLERR